VSYIRADNAKEQEYFDYLEELRQSGDTNMFGAGQYLEAAFDLNKAAARKILCNWMKGHNDDSRILKKPTSAKKVKVKFVTETIVDRQERRT
jgi:hypothetical protein